MSDWVSTCDAIISDLTGAITTLATGLTVHRYAPMDPTELVRDKALVTGRHLAVWPVGDVASETSEGGFLLNGSVELIQDYRVLVWEPSPDAERGRPDSDANLQTWLQLHNDVRARFLRPAQSFGGAYLTRYITTEFPESPGLVRWFRLLVRSRSNVPLT